MRGRNCRSRVRWGEFLLKIKALIILIQAPLAKSKGDGGGYRLKFGQEIYYCKPYRPFHTQLRYNFSGLPSSSSETVWSLFGREERGFYWVEVLRQSVNPLRWRGRVSR